MITINRLYIENYRGIIRMCERVAASGGTPTPYSA